MAIVDVIVGAFVNLDGRILGIDLALNERLEDFWDPDEKRIWPAVETISKERCSWTPPEFFNSFLSRKMPWSEAKSCSAASSFLSFVRGISSIKRTESTFKTFKRFACL